MTDQNLWLSQLSPEELEALRGHRAAMRRRMSIPADVLVPGWGAEQGLEPVPVGAADT